MDFSMLFIVSNLKQLVKNGKQMKKSTFCLFDVSAHQSKKNSCPAIDVMKHLWERGGRGEREGDGEGERGGVIDGFIYKGCMKSERNVVHVLFTCFAGQKKKMA